MQSPKRYNLAEDYLNKLTQRGRDFLNSQHAIMGGAMSWVSNHQLVAAISNAGALGVLAAGGMNPTELLNEIKLTKERTSKGFGVNIIVMHPKILELIDVCVEEKVPYVIFGGGIPSKDFIDKFKSEGIKTMGFAPSVLIGKKLVQNGIDALIIEGLEAGGHIGPVSTSVLAQEILPKIKEIPIFIAGGIGRGETIVNYLEMGAAGCQLGTKFVCAEESPAHINFKEAFIRARAHDTVVTSQIDPKFPVIPVRSIGNQATKDFISFQKETLDKFYKGEIDQHQAHLELEYFWSGSLKKAVLEGDVERGSLMAGQSVGMVEKIEPVAEIINSLYNQAIEFIEHKLSYADI